MSRTQRDRIINKLEAEDKVNDKHVFLVRNLEKREDKQYWAAVPGSVMSMFVTGSHEWHYLGPRNSEAVNKKIAEINAAQAHIVGEKKQDTVDTYEVELELSDLGLAPAKVSEAMDIPVDELVPAKSKSKSRKKKKDGE